MKKILMIMMSCLLIGGCGYRQVSKDQEEPVRNQTVVYMKDDIVLKLVYSDDFPDGFEFQFELNDQGIGEFACFKEGTYQEAIGQQNEDGHSYYFTIKKDTVIVKESEGENALGIDLSGKYIKK